MMCFLIHCAAQVMVMPDRLFAVVSLQRRHDLENIVIVIVNRVVAPGCLSYSMVTVQSQKMQFMAEKRKNASSARCLNNRRGFVP